jgi:hypothetical protein
MESGIKFFCPLSEYFKQGNRSWLKLIHVLIKCNSWSLYSGFFSFSLMSFILEINASADESIAVHNDENII